MRSPRNPGNEAGDRLTQPVCNSAAMAPTNGAVQFRPIAPSPSLACTRRQVPESCIVMQHVLRYVAKSEPGTGLSATAWAGPRRLWPWPARSSRLRMRKIRAGAFTWTCGLYSARARCSFFFFPPIAGDLVATHSPLYLRISVELNSRWEQAEVHVAPSWRRSIKNMTKDMKSTE